MKAVGKERESKLQCFFHGSGPFIAQQAALCSYTDRAAVHVVGSTDLGMMDKETTFQRLSHHRHLLNQCGCLIKQVTSNPTGTLLLPLSRMSWKIFTCIGN